MPDKPRVSHKTLVQALAGGDPDKAERAFRRHATRRKQRLLKLIDTIEQQKLKAAAE